MRKKTSTFGAAMLRGLAFAAVSAVAVHAAETVRLSPEKVVELATTQNTMIRASELGIKAQENARKSAFTGFLPTMSGTAGATHLVTQPKLEGFGGGGTVDTSTLDPITRSIMTALGNMLDFSGMSMSPSNIYSVGMTVAQPFFTGGKILNAYRIQKYSTNAQKYTLEQTKAEMGYVALSLYWGYVATVKGLEATIETRRWFETLAGDQQKMFQNGLLIELDVLNTKIQLDNFRLLEIKMQDMISTIGGQLQLFLGLPADASIEVDTTNLRSDEVVTVRPAADSIEAWLAVRNDLRALRCQLEMMHCLEKIQKAAYAPTIAGFVNLAYSNQYSMSDETKFDNTSSFGVSLNWPLFDWGKGVRETQKIRYQSEALSLQISNLGEQVRLKKNELARKIAQTSQACAIAREDVAIATKALEIAQVKYNAQTITSTELLTTRNQLTSKAFAYTQACISVKLALAEYKLAPLSSGSAQTAGSSMDAAAQAPPSGTSGAGANRP